MATTEEFKNGGSTSYSTSIEYIKASDIKVEIDGSPLTYTTNTTPTSGQYKVVGTNVTLGATAAAGSGNVHIFRETDLDTAAAVFAAGSSIRAQDLNACHDMVRFASQEQHQLQRTPDIKDQAVTSAKIQDGTIVDADISGSAAIAQSKIATGNLPSGITVNSDNIVNGSIVNDDISASADIAGSKLLDDSVTLDKLGSGSLPTDITVSRDNIVNGTIQDADIETGTLDNRYYTETELDNGQLDNRYYTETELLTGGAIDGRYYTESELDSGQLDNRYFTETELTTGAIDGRYYTETELDNGSLDSRYFTESETLNGAIDSRYYTETELDAGQLDNRYYTETELDAGQLDNRYFTETEADARFLRQDSTDVIDTNATWTTGNTHVATTGAIEARVIDLIDDVGGFTAIANETSFPATNPQGSTGQAAILSIAAVSTTLTPSSNVLTIPNGAGTGNTVTINNVTASSIPTGFGLLVESTATLHTYNFHRLVPKALDVNTVSTNIANIVIAGQNVGDINNFVDLYQINNNAPTQRVDGNALQNGDLWFDRANSNLRVYDGTNWAIISPNQAVLNDIAIVSGAITYQEDLGLISDSVTTGSSNGSLDIVADILEDEATFTVTASGGKYLIDGVQAPTLTLYKGWTYTFDLSDASNAYHPLRFYAGSSQYSTDVTVTGTQGTAGAKVSIKIPETQPTNFQYYCTNHSGMGNTITVKDDPIKTVSDNISQIQTVASDLTESTSEIDTVATNIANVNAVGTNIANVNAVNSNETNINSVKNNATNINIVAGDITNVNTVASNMANVDNFTDKYQIAASAPSTDGGGNALADGDLYFDTSANELKVYNGSTWQGGVTASGNFATSTGNTFTGDNTYNDNVKAKFGSSGEMTVYHTGTHSYIHNLGGHLHISNATGNDTSNLYLKAKQDKHGVTIKDDGEVEINYDGNVKAVTNTNGLSVTGLMAATTIDGAAGNNLQLDFGTL